jgi:hypothetical protein
MQRKRLRGLAGLFIDSLRERNKQGNNLMNALKITKSLKANRKSLLWINDERRESAFHPNNGAPCESVDYNAAVMAKSDPCFGVVDTTDGTTYAAI